MNRILSYLLLLSWMVACKDDRRIKPEDPVPPILSGQLKKISLVADNTGKLTIKYEYVDSLTLKSMEYNLNGRTWKEEFTYNKKQLLYSVAGDTVKKYIYQQDKLYAIEREIKSDPAKNSSTQFIYLSGDKVLQIVNKALTGNPGGATQSDYTLIWRGENVNYFRERHHTGYIEEIDSEFGTTFNPVARIYTKILRIPADNPEFLSQNSRINYNAYFTGKRYKISGTYTETGLPSQEFIYINDLTSDNEWKIIKEINYETMNKGVVL